MRFKIGMKFRDNNNDFFTQCELGLVHCTLLSIIKILMNYYGRKKVHKPPHMERISFFIY